MLRGSRTPPPPRTPNAGRVSSAASDASPFLAAPLRRLGYDSRELWAWDNYQASVLGFVDHCRMTGRHEGGLVRVLEIGGGRGPLMTPREAADARIAYAVNDIDARELAMGPAEFEKVQFDVAGVVDPTLLGRFDLVISRMVMEHVRDAERAWTNMCGSARARRRGARLPSDTLRPAVPDQLARA